VFVDVKREKNTDSIHTGVFSKHLIFYGSSPNALAVDSTGSTLYVANGMDNAIEVY
jgi:DNA-binding beta-propeller fold protein YncE